MSNASCLVSGWNFNRNSNERLKYLFIFHEIVPFSETDKVGITLRSLRPTLCAVKKGCVTYSEYVSLFFPQLHNLHIASFSAPYFIVISGLFGSTAFLHIIPQTALHSGNLYCI